MKEQDKNKEEWRYRKKRKPVYSIQIKSAAIAEIESGVKNRYQILEEYSIKAETLKDWYKQVAYFKKGIVAKRRYPQTTRRKVARDILMGYLTIKQAMAKYEIRTKASIKNWIKEYQTGLDIETNLPGQPKEPDEEAIEKNYLERDYIQSQEKLEKAKLKIVALETLIDVAEKELGVDIRKKSGTKQ